MTLAINKMDGHGHINTVCREFLPKKTKVMRYQLQKDYRKDGALHLWPNLPKGLLYMHSFRSHFSQPFDRYNNRGSCLYHCQNFNSLFLLRPHSWACLVFTGARVVCKCSNFPGQADSQQGITTELVGETGHQCSYILWHVELKTAWIEAI